MCQFLSDHQGTLLAAFAIVVALALWHWQRQLGTATLGFIPAEEAPLDESELTSTSQPVTRTTRLEEEIFDDQNPSIRRFANERAEAMASLRKGATDATAH